MMSLVTSLPVASLSSEVKRVSLVFSLSVASQYSVAWMLLSDWPLPVASTLSVMIRTMSSVVSLSETSVLSEAWVMS